MKPTMGALFLFAGLVIAVPAGAATEIGKVTRLQGDCRGVSEGKTQALVTGMAIELDEQITTGKGARLELTFEDGTRLTVGERASVKIDAYVYRPRALGNRLDAVIAGPFRYVSGALMKTAASSASVRTPFATIGIRGTDFWGGPLAGKSGVFLIEGSVKVTNAGGAAELRHPGEGVDIDANGAPPGGVREWAKAKVNRALATVTFR